MAEEFTITCPGCNTDLEIEGTKEDWAGETIECPQCNTQISIPWQNKSPYCPGCKQIVHVNAMVCAHCGINLKTGQKPQLKSQRHANSASGGLRLRKDTSQTSSSTPSSPNINMPSNNKKRCKRCNSMIDKKATKCPNCHSEQWSRKGCLFVVICLIISASIIYLVIPSKEERARRREERLKSDIFYQLRYQSGRIDAEHAWTVGETDREAALESYVLIRREEAEADMKINGLMTRKPIPNDDYKKGFRDMWDELVAKNSSNNTNDTSKGGNH